MDKYIPFKKTTEFLEFIEVPFEGKTKWFEVRSVRSDELLGKIQFRPGWRCYVFEPCFPTIWSSDCLMDIQVFLNTLNDERKKI